MIDCIFERCHALKPGPDKSEQNASLVRDALSWCSLMAVDRFQAPESHEIMC